MSTYIASLDEVAENEQVLLIGRDLDVVGTDDGLNFIRVVKALGVVKVGDVQGSDVVASSDGEVGKLSIVCEVGVDGRGSLGPGAKVVKQLSNTLLAVGVVAEGVDDPDLAGSNSSGKSSGLGMTRNELDVLDALAVGNLNGRDDGAVL